MTNAKQEIHSWLMQQQMPKGIGFQPGGQPRSFSGTASFAPGAIGAGSRFGSPITRSQHNQFTRTPADQTRGAGADRRGVPSMPQTWQPQYHVGVSESELPATETPTENFNSRYHADQRLNGAPLSLDPEANVSEALLYAQNENRMAPISYADNIQQQIRKFPVKRGLEEKLAESVYDVFGPGYSVEIGSAGQPKAGTDLEALNMTRDTGWTRADELKDPNDTEFKGRIGAENHDHGEAADFRIIGPDGLPVPEDKQGGFLQYWYANKHGRAAPGMARGGIHADERTGGRRYYEYDPQGKVTLSRNRMKKWADRGRDGKMPELYQSPGMPDPSMSAAELGIEDPMNNLGPSDMHNTFGSADPDAMASEAYEYSKHLQDPYREPIAPKPNARPTR